jgi:hypothetical protein
MITFVKIKYPALLDNHGLKLHDPFDMSRILETMLFEKTAGSFIRHPTIL